MIAIPAILIPLKWAKNHTKPLRAGSLYFVYVSGMSTVSLLVVIGVEWVYVRLRLHDASGSLFPNAGVQRSDRVDQGHKR